MYGCQMKAPPLCVANARIIATVLSMTFITHIRNAFEIFVLV